MQTGDGMSPRPRPEGQLQGGRGRTWLPQHMAGGLEGQAGPEDIF